MFDRSFLQASFGISYLRPYQELIITRIEECLESKSKVGILGCLPTGSGKSLCFMYPIAHLKERALLVYPLLSLMNDQKLRFDKAGIPAVILRGGTRWEERQQCIQRIQSGSSLITNPEMLAAMEKRGELAKLKGLFSMAVVDEVHTLPTWGESFRESYLELPALLKALDVRATLAFTATMDKEIERGIVKTLFGGDEPYIVRGSADRDNIFYHSVQSLSKMHDVISILEKEDAKPALIFCRSRRLAESVAKHLSPLFDIKHYHAGLGKDEKEEKEKWFRESTEGVLSATSAYGLGVDAPGIRSVIHLSLPSDVPEFLQEAGRGGRDGRRVDSYVLYYKDEESPLSRIFKGEKCIRQSLLSAMGEETESDGCLGCSHCVNDSFRRSGEEEILRYIRHHPFSKAESIASALGAPHIFFRSRRLPTWTKDEITAAIMRLEDEGRLRKAFSRFFLPPRYGKIAKKESTNASFTSSGLP